MLHNHRCQVFLQTISSGRCWPLSSGCPLQEITYRPRGKHRGFGILFMFHLFLKEQSKNNCTSLIKSKECVDLLEAVILYTHTHTHTKPITCHHRLKWAGFGSGHYPLIQPTTAQRVSSGVCVYSTCVFVHFCMFLSSLFRLFPA